MNDDRAKVLPDKVRHLEARVARLEDTVGMLEKNPPEAITSREARTLLGLVAMVGGVALVFVLSKRSVHDA